jgi:hypothetical protein
MHSEQLLGADVKSLSRAISAQTLPLDGPPPPSASARWSPAPQEQIAHQPARDRPGPLRPGDARRRAVEHDVHVRERRSGRRRDQALTPRSSRCLPMNVPFLLPCPRRHVSTSLPSPAVARRACSCARGQRACTRGQRLEGQRQLQVGTAADPDLATSSANSTLRSATGCGRRRRIVRSWHTRNRTGMEAGLLYLK